MEAHAGQGIEHPFGGQVLIGVLGGPAHCAIVPAPTGAESRPQGQTTALCTRIIGLTFLVSMHII
jgi:hypothetical protein